MTLEEKLELFKNSRFTLFIENEPINLCDVIEDIIFELEKSKKFNEELNKSFERLEMYTISGYEEILKDLNKANIMLDGKLEIAEKNVKILNQENEVLKKKLELAFIHLKYIDVHYHTNGFYLRDFKNILDEIE